MFVKPSDLVTKSEPRSPPVLIQCYQGRFIVFNVTGVQNIPDSARIFPIYSAPRKRRSVDGACATTSERDQMRKFAIERLRLARQLDSQHALQATAIKLSELAKEGRHCHQLTELYGINDEKLIEQIEMASVNGPAGEAVLKGKNYRRVMRKFGLVTLKARMALETLSDTRPLSQDRQERNKTRSLSPAERAIIQGAKRKLVWMQGEHDARSIADSTRLKTG